MFDFNSCLFDEKGAQTFPSSRGIFQRKCREQRAQTRLRTDTSYVAIPLLSDGEETNRPIDTYRSNAKGLLTAFDPVNFNGYGLITDIGGPDDTNKEFIVSLVRIDSGVESVLASTIMAFTTEWMTDLIVEESGRVKAKKWLASQPEPTGFLFDVADNTYSGGFTGIVATTTPENPSVTWQFDNVSGSSIPEPSTLAIWCLLATLGITVGWWRRGRAA